MATTSQSPSPAAFLGSSSAESSYFRRLDRPLLSREDELALTSAVLAAETERTSALLGVPEGRAALAEILDGLVAGTASLVDLVRNVDVDPELAKAQRRRVLALRRAMKTSAGARAVVRRAVALRLHPSVVERIEEELRRDPPSALIARALRRADRARRRRDIAKQELVERNLRLVVSYARRFVQQGMGLLDLVQEGNLGLMHAIEKFDPAKGYRLTTYASWWIKQTIQRALADRGATIRVPVHLHVSRGLVFRAQRRLLAERSASPTMTEIAAGSGVAVERVAQILSLPAEPVSLDAPVGGETDLVLVDTIASDAHPPADDATAAALLRGRVQSLVAVLSERERLVLTLRFGLDGSAGRTLEEVGDELSLTRERIRQIETLALRKLRDYCARRNMTFELEK